MFENEIPDSTYYKDATVWFKPESDSIGIFLARDEIMEVGETAGVFMKYPNEKGWVFIGLL